MVIAEHIRVGKSGTDCTADGLYLFDMPMVSFESLPDESRVWIFGSDRSLDDQDSRVLLGEVDRFLTQWKAHGMPLTCARDWRGGALLTIGVDTTHENASGCSIDGLFRTLQGLERSLHTRLLGGGRVFYRDHQGSVHCLDRQRLPELAAAGEIDDETRVFDTGLTTAGEWRARFEAKAGETWVGSLLRA